MINPNETKWSFYLLLIILGVLIVCGIVHYVKKNKKAKDQNALDTVPQTPTDPSEEAPEDGE